MIEIPRILKQDGFRFILVKKGLKDPIEVGWSTKNNYCYNDPKLLAHLARNGNYGIVGGFGNLVVQDFDDLAVYLKFYDTKKIEATFPTVRTGGGKRHIYCTTPEPQKSFRIPQIHLEVRGVGNFVVGPNCVHPSGNRYELINNVSEIPVVADLEGVILNTAEKRFGVAQSTPRQGASAPVDFTGEYMSLPCVRFLLSQKLPEGGRKIHAAKMMAIAWVKDHGTAEGFDSVARQFSSLQTLGNPPLDYKEVYPWGKCVERNRLKWSCAEIITYLRDCGIFPTCDGCKIREAKRDGV